MADQRLGQLHQVAVVGVGLVKLQHRELGVVLRGDPFVPEVAVDLVDPINAPDDEPLQVELRGDAEVEVQVQRVVVGDEGAGRRAAGDGLHHRRLHLQEAPRVQELADLLHEAAPQPEDRPGFLVHDQIEIALAVAPLDVLEAVPFLGERAQGLRQEGKGLHRDRELAGPRPEQLARDADEIAGVQVGEEPVLVAELVGARIKLDGPGVVLEGREAGLPVVPEGQDAPSHADGSDPFEFLLRGRVELPDETAGPVSDRVPPPEGIHTSGPESRQLFVTAPDEVVLVGLGGHRQIILRRLARQEVSPDEGID